MLFLFFFFNDTATTEIYTLSLHDALPILRSVITRVFPVPAPAMTSSGPSPWVMDRRSEEHTSELQSHLNLVCRLLLEKKKKENVKNKKYQYISHILLYIHHSYSDTTFYA